MKNIDIQFYKSTFGELIVGSYENTLCLVDWRYRKMRDRIDQRVQKGLSAEYVERNTSITHETITQIEEYTRGERTEFELPLTFVGTDFQKSVWEALRKIEFGQTISYLELAQKVADETALIKKSLPTRAVATANGANAISIIVPCHRVIGSDGQLVGYAGGLNAKKKLLKRENVFESQLDLFS